jgi:hypothetical protein
VEKEVEETVEEEKEVEGMAVVKEEEVMVVEMVVAMKEVEMADS